jgi:hypothetical protein
MGMTTLGRIFLRVVRAHGRGGDGSHRMTPGVHGRRALSLIHGVYCASNPPSVVGPSVMRPGHLEIIRPGASIHAHKGGETAFFDSVPNRRRGAAPDLENVFGSLVGSHTNTSRECESMNSSYLVRHDHVRTTRLRCPSILGRARIHVGLAKSIRTSPRFGAKDERGVRLGRTKRLPPATYAAHPAAPRRRSISVIHCRSFAQ